MEIVTEQIRVMRFPLALAGTRIGRTVTLIRLSSGKVVIHSTAAFSREDLVAISNFGTPAAMIEATLLHDTFAQRARDLFPTIPYFVPPGFPNQSTLSATSLAEPPAWWNGELEVLPLEGMPQVHEHVLFHLSSRTLIVADSVFTLDSSEHWWTRFFFRNIAGIKQPPGMSRFFRMLIRDRKAFQRSVQNVMIRDFDRVIVAHGEMIEHDGKAKLARAWSEFLSTNNSRGSMDER